MGILGMIKQAKDKFTSVKKNLTQAGTDIRVAQLQKLREERLKIEQKATLETLKQDEERRINAAKQTIRKGSTLNKFATGLKNVTNRANQGSSGMQFGGSSSPFASSGKGIDFGGGNKSGGLQLGGSSKPKAIKKRGKTIIIKI